MEASPKFRTADELLGTRVAAGDRGAFDELYRRYVGPLSSYGARMLHDHSAGEDVAQTALLNAFRALESGTAPTSMRPWLYRIAHNAALGTLRGGGDVPMETAHEPQQSDDLEARATRNVLIAGVGDLPELQRRVYLLREVRGLSVREIATELDLTSESVEQALFRAKNKLAERLVFGGAVTCELVRLKEPSGFARGERRVVKAHLRCCSTCRAELAAAGGASGSLTAGLLGLLQRFGSIMTASGAPVAAKFSAVAVTALLGASAAGVPNLHHLWRGVVVVVVATASAAVDPSMPAAVTPAALVLSPADVLPAFLRRETPSMLPSPAGFSSAAAPPFVATGTGATGGAATDSPGTTKGETPTDTVTTDETVTDETPPGSPSGDSAPDPSATDGADPAANDPSTDPSATDPASTDPAPTDPAPSDPAVDPTPDPTPPDPIPPDPVPPDPAPVGTTPL